jgi:hypothetical protein
MFITDSSIWLKIAGFARDLGNSEDFISTAKKDFNEFVSQFDETIRTANSKYTSKECDNLLSMSILKAWRFNFNLICLYMLLLSGFRHTALRELRFYLEASFRAYYIDSKYHGMNYKRKVKKLKLKKVRYKKNKELLANLSREKRKEFLDFYSELCDYVHLSEISQTDALRDSGLNLSLSHPNYEEDKEMLEKTFGYLRHLFLQTLERR